MRDMDHGGMPMSDLRACLARAGLEASIAGEEGIATLMASDYEGIKFNILAFRANQQSDKFVFALLKALWGIGDMNEMHVLRALNDWYSSGSLNIMGRTYLRNANVVFELDADLRVIPKSLLHIRLITWKVLLPEFRDYMENSL